MIIGRRNASLNLRPERGDEIASALWADRQAIEDLIRTHKVSPDDALDAWKRLYANPTKRNNIDYLRRAASGAPSWFSLPSFKGLTSKIPLVDNGSLTNLPQSFWNDPLSTLKVTPSNASWEQSMVNQIKNGDPGGNLTEDLVDGIMTRNGYTLADGKYGGNNGLDGVYYKGDLANPTEIIIIESKQMTSGASSLSKAAGALPSQMSDSWIDYIGLQKLRGLGGDKTILSNTLISNRAMIQKYVAAVDKNTSQINFLKLGNF